MSKTANDGHRCRLTHEDAMAIWRARDVYRVESAGYGCLGTVFLLMVFVTALKGRWDGVLALVVLQGLALWGVPWLLRLAWRGIRAWWRQLILVMVLMGLLTGCQEYARTVARLYGYTGDPFPGPCAAERFQVGHCVPVKQEGAKP